MRNSGLGFTLVEILIATTVSAFVIVTLVGLFGNLLSVSAVVRERAEIREDAELAVSLLQRDLRQAERIFSAPGPSLELLSASGDTIRYEWSGTPGDTLTRRVNSSAPAPIAAYIDTAGFSTLTVTRPYTTEVLEENVAEEILAAHEEGYWNYWIDCCGCEYDGSEEGKQEERIEDNEMSAAEWWNKEAFDELSRISLWLRTKDHFPAQADLAVSIHEEQGGWPYYPGTLVATGLLSRFAHAAKDVWAWHTIDLTMVAETTIKANAPYWIVLRSQFAGGNTYACHVRWQKLKNCFQWPVTAICYRKSNDWGNTWDACDNQRDLFFVLYGRRTDSRVEEVTQTIVDTTGVEYYVGLKRDDAIETRSGQVSIHDL